MAVTGTTSLDQQKHLDIMDALEEIASALRASNLPTLAPIVKVAASPASVVVSPSRVVIQEREPFMPTYVFTVRRNHVGFIMEIIARPMINE